MKKYEKVNKLFGAGISLVIAIFFLVLINVDMDDFFIRESYVFPVNNTVFTKIIYFPVEGDYVLQLKYNDSETDIEVATLNRYRLEVRVGNDSSSGIVSRYYYVPKKIIKKRNNFLKIKFYPTNPLEIDVRMKNYLVEGANGNIVLTLKDAMSEHKNFQQRVFLAIVFFLFSFLFWNMLMYVQVRFLELSLRQSIIYNCISFFPITFLLLFLGGISLKGPYVLVLSPHFVFILFFVITISSVCFINILPVFIEYFAKILFASTEQREKILLPSLVKSMVMWVYRRKFSEKLILLFMFLFIFADILYNSGMVNYAEWLSASAFWLLIAGVVLCFVSAMKERE